MKKILFFITICGTLLACEQTQNTQNTEEETEVTTIVEEETVKTTTGFYGEKISEEGAISSAELKNSLAENDSATFKVTGKIAETCVKKGCWMTVDMGEDEAMRVSFKDYEFFVPKSGMEGKEVVFEGMVKKSVTTAAQLKHFAKDAGKTQEEIDLITEDKEELTFVANGVIIKDVGVVEEESTEEEEKEEEHSEK
jgi:hypothetical protein